MTKKDGRAGPRTSAQLANLEKAREARKAKRELIQKATGIGPRGTQDASRKYMHSLVNGIPLTPQQAIFCREYLTHGDSKEAYRKAYKPDKALKEDEIYRRAQRIFQSQGVVNTISTLLRNSLPDIDANHLISLLFMAINGSMSKEDFATMGTNIERVAKLSGQWVDRKEIKQVNQVVSVDINLGMGKVIEHNVQDGTTGTMTPRHADTLEESKAYPIVQLSPDDD